MARLHSFDELIGHDWLKTYLLSKLNTNTLPHFIIIDGPEGLGKTSIADLLALHLVYGDSPDTAVIEEIIDKRKSTTNVKKFVMYMIVIKINVLNLVHELIKIADDIINNNKKENN